MEKMNWMRRKFLHGSSLLGASFLLGRTTSAQHEGHDAPKRGQQSKTGKQRPDKAATREDDHAKMIADRSKPAAGQYTPVQTPDLPKLEYTMEDGVKVFNLRAEVVHCELMPKSHMGPARKMWGWGYNGSVPGPMIEVVEGDHVRVIFENKLPEPTTIHWHGLEIPIEMDGTPYISQPMVEPGGVFIYEFTVNQNGTFFYHSHGAMQEMIGMVGLFVIHPRTPHTPRVDKDFGLILQEWALLPNNDVPNTLSMEFNWLTINGKSAPATTPLIIKIGERVRIRMVNIGMDHHPMHLHGVQFYVTGTEGGRIPETAWYPGNTVIVGVAQARDIEFVAQYEGDWMLHCHLPHHMMNQMVSMVGPMMMSHGVGSQTGLGMEEGMGMLRQGHALSEDFGPGMGRGMAMTTAGQPVSNLVGQQTTAPHDLYVCPMHPDVRSNKEGDCPKCGMKLVKQQKPEIYTCPMHPDVVSTRQGSCPKCKMTLVRKQQTTVALTEEEKKKVPGYPQDMTMIVDEDVAKPEAWGLAPGWSASVMGMMTLVRVLSQEKYDKVMAMIKGDHHSGVNNRGDKVMGFSHERTTHHFRLKTDGGLIEVDANDQNDAASREQIRTHLQHISQKFASGDFTAPMLIHAQTPPGVPVMKQLKSEIKYQYEQTDRGARVRITTNNPKALSAIHEFLRFQISDHKTGDSGEIEK